MTQETTESGLKITILRNGDGESPKMGQTVMMPKDDIYSKGESIEGLDQALMSMKVGDRWSLVIPAELGYGEEGASSFHTFHGYRAPPNQGIRCNIELVDIMEEENG